MTVIVTHPRADFDALSSCYALSKIYKDSFVYFPDKPQNNVQKFLRDFPHIFQFFDERNLSKVKRVVMADVSSWRRVGILSRLKGKVQLHIYDHHRHYIEDAKFDFPESFGATVTGIVEILRKRKIPISDFDATIYLLGIYEDTGFLEYSSTTKKDVLIAKYLLKKANKSLVHRYLGIELSEKQRELFEVFKRNREIIKVNSIKIIFYHAFLRDFKEEISPVIHFFKRIKDSVMVFVLQSEKKTNIIVRSESKELGADEVARVFGGGGLRYASSAVVIGIGYEEIKNKILDYVKGLKESIDISKFIPQTYFQLLKRIGEIANLSGMRVYLVGGIVRDMLFGNRSIDFDIVCEGDAILLGRRIKEELGFSLKENRIFKTCLLEKDDIKFDLATARKEVYPYPGSLPKVSPSNIIEDLKRRDFTINSIAISINKDDFGRFIDPFNGRKDIREKELRVLHEKSFHEDPTRILRAVRFIARFNLELEKKTEKLLKEALRKRYLSLIPPPRFKNELFLILNEKDIISVLDRFFRWNLGIYIHRKLTKDFYFKNLKKIIELSGDTLFDFILYIEAVSYTHLTLPTKA